jgi:uncharacterized protein YktB (UPF0637 family)
VVLFTLEDFAVFKATTLATRMHLIREQLDPKFAEAATVIVPLLQTDQQAIYSHIAKHQRRYRNPPPNTWVAFSTSSRGYKMVPHLALGFWDDRLFLWLSVLRESKPAPRVLTGITAMATTLPGKWQVAGEHTDKAMLPLTSANLATVRARFQTIKKAEFLLGKVYLADDPIWADPVRLWQDIQQRVVALKPMFDQLVQNV